MNNRIPSFAGCKDTDFPPTSKQFPGVFNTKQTTAWVTGGLFSLEGKGRGKSGRRTFGLLPLIGDLPRAKGLNCDYKTTGWGCVQADGRSTFPVQGVQMERDERPSRLLRTAVCCCTENQLSR